MTHKINNRSAQVMVVESNSTRRSGLVEVVKKLGFKGVKAANSLQDAVQYSEQVGFAPDWIITTLFADQDMNGLNLLRHATAHKDWLRCRVSLIYEAEQGWCLRKAFELGLFSCHPKTEDMTSITLSLNQLIERGDYWNWRDSLIAASYLRDTLKLDQKQSSSGAATLVKLERSLLGVFPDMQESIMLELVTSLIANKNPQLALAILNKSATFSPQFQTKVDELNQKALSQVAGNGVNAATFAQTWEISRCVLVDSDASGLNLVENALKEMGVSEIQGFQNGEDALAALKDKPEPDLIVQEWRIPKVSGDRFVQRVRLMGFSTVPIIVFSSLVKPNDRHILREMGVSEVISKPQNTKMLVSLLMQIIEEEKRPRGEKAVEIRIRKALQLGNPNAAKHLFKANFREGKTAHKITTILAAEIAYAEGNLKDAEALASEALMLNGEDTMILNLLGKIHIKLKQLAKAERFFAKAESLAPGNVERLCQLAEVKAEQADMAGADAELSKAQKIAPDAPMVQSSVAKIAVLSADEGRLKSVMNQIESQSEIVAFLNNRAVGLAASGSAKEGVSLYQKAIKSMPKSMNHHAPTVLYNMALAMIKSGGLDKDAQAALKNALKMPESPLHQRIKSLADRLDQAIADGTPMVLNQSSASDSGAKGKPIQSQDVSTEAYNLNLNKNASAMLLLEQDPVNPGDYCCFKIYVDDDPENPKVAALIKAPSRAVGRHTKKAS